MNAAELPIEAVVPEVLASLQRGNVVLQAEPGAGKSTGLPLSLLAAADTNARIVMLEPRRLAARSVAERLAEQLGEPLGLQVGLRMRAYTSVSEHTRIEVVTEGVLTRILQADPLLEGIGLIVFDEFHERSLHADLGLTLCLEVQRELRADLRLLLMSATFDSAVLGRFLPDAQQIRCAGRQYPVSVNWLGQAGAAPAARVARAVLQALQHDSGDILVFLPGVAEIESAARLLQPDLPATIRLLRLHGRADSSIQRAATAAAGSQRRVILSTSIAETSLTIDGVGVVIDSGLERRSRMDSSSGALRLETVTASQASAEQRRGRAGRTAAGVCYRLWSESEHARRAADWQAEILRADLAPLWLELAQWGTREIEKLQWLDPPPPAALSRAQALLQALGIWRHGALTEHGKAVSRLPVHPRIGQMLIWASRRGAGEPACRLAVLLEEGSRSVSAVDLEQALTEPLTKPQQRRVGQLQRLLQTSTGQHRLPAPGILLAQAYPDWIARSRDGADGRYALACGAGACMDSEQPLAHSRWLAVAQLGGAGREARIFAACSLDIDELQAWSPELFSTSERVEWDERQQRVLAEEQTLTGKLVLATRTLDTVDSDKRAQALLSGIRRKGLQCLPWTDECRQWQARVQTAATLNPTADSGHWPAVDDATLFSQLQHWLLPWLDGISSLKSLSQLRLRSVLHAMLDYRQQALLDELLPERYTVPSGSLIRLRYAAGEVPVLSVRLQEMFGCKTNPVIADGAITLKVELLSPARRPVQLTQDMANFWENSYPAVRKEMAGRYPKHYWPDNPLQALPSARTTARPDAKTAARSAGRPATRGKSGKRR